VLRVEALRAGYGQKPVIHSVDLAVAPGKAVAVVGPNGAGKSTLLRAIAGSLRPMSGDIHFGDARIARQSAFKTARAGVLLVPEGREIFGELTVLDNLLLGKLAAGNRQTGIAFGIDEVFALFPRLRERQRQHGGSLSGGEQQMLAIGRALMGRPNLLLLDEPSLGLAPVIVDQMFAALQQLLIGGVSMLIVEQRVQRVLSIVDYAYVIERGRIVKQGTGRELLNDPDMASHYLGG